MPDTLNKQSLINLLIDSPLREPIKINLIDIVNNTSDPDLPKVYGTITKELEIFQKATERRMKLAEETITKLGGVATPTPPAPAPSAPPQPEPPIDQPSLSVPPLDLPPLPTAPAPIAPEEPSIAESTPPSATPTPQPLGATATSSDSDEDALAEIQKELDSLKTEAESEVASDAAVAPSPATPPTPQASTQS